MVIILYMGSVQCHFKFNSLRSRSIVLEMMMSQVTHTVTNSGDRIASGMECFW